MIGQYPAGHRNNKDAEMQQSKVQGWKAEELAQLLNGRWTTTPSDDWFADDIALKIFDLKLPGRRYLLVAIDSDTWHKGSGNMGIYAGWQDTHEMLKRHHDKFCGAIVQRFIPELPADFPQLVVENSYNVLNMMADESRRRMHGKVVAVTGTVGKSSTKDLLNSLLSEEGTTLSTRGNHNTRTGTAVSLARCITDPDFVALEVAISALWIESLGVGARIQADVAIITEIGLTQVSHYVKGVRDTARHKARLCQGMKVGGYAVLNRDMDDFDYVRQTVTEYGAQVVTYGFHPQADIPIVSYQPDTSGSHITLMINNQPTSYRLNVPGRGMAGNSAAALATLHLLGADVQLAAKRVSWFRNVAKKLQAETLRLPTGGAVTLIDDNYNAALISMKNGLEVAALYPRGENQRRIAVLGRLATLGELAQVSHEALAEPILEAGFDKVYMHGKEMLALKEKLPAQMIGGYFTDVDSMADKVLSELRDGDVVLVKGSVSDSDFHLIIGKMKERLKSSVVPLGRDVATLRVNLNTGSVQRAHNGYKTFNPRHLSHLLITTALAEGLVAKKHRLSDAVSTKAIADSVLQQGPALGLKNGQKMSVKSLLQGMLIANARDAAVNLAEYLSGTAADHLAALPGLMERAGMQKSSLNNVAGRTSQGQRTSLDDLAALVSYFYRSYPQFIHWLADFEAEIGGVICKKVSNIQADGRASYSFASGGSPCWGFAIHRRDNDVWLACAAGAKDTFHLDYLLDGLLAPEVDVVAPDAITLPEGKATTTVTLVGDTYFGEWYSAQRAKRGVDDALQRYCYDHSFKGIAPLLEGSDYTIANFEAALAYDNENGLQGRKPFCLTGDPLRSVAALKKAGIDAVALGNNHVMDAGISGLQSTLDALRDGGIASFGAGLNAQQAEAPLTLMVGGRTFKFYSAYWYRRYMEQDCAFYAQPRRAGAACLSGGLLEQLSQDKSGDEPVTTIVMAHWGQDYRWTLPQQKQLAKRLTQAGADLIVGCGPHMLGEFEQLGDSWVAYSIGNGVFNSNGEYRQRGVPAFGFITRLVIGGDQPQLQLLPIFTNNPETFWQPRPVTDDEFTQVIAVLEQQGVSFADGGARIATLSEGRKAIVLPLTAKFTAVSSNS